MTCRLKTPLADHYFINNEGVEKNVFINAQDVQYLSGEYVLENVVLDVDGTISVTVPEKSAVWVRLEK
jgi:hypothetical protein